MWQKLGNFLKAKQWRVELETGNPNDTRYNPMQPGTTVVFSPQRLARGLLILFLVGLLWWWLTMPSTGSVFQASSNVPLTDVHRHVIQYGKYMSLYLKHNHHICGISLPHFRVYEKYAILRQRTTEAFTHMINPWLDPELNSPNNTRTRTVHESSIMCGNDRERETTRFQHINVTYYTMEGVQFTTAYEGDLAFCIQHHIDIFEGLWPCVDLGNDTMATFIPMMPELEDRDSL